tara:strand:- start:7768 stop:10731 length:2964 start_codon:yes stop_codon:yes gene_type:complete
MARYSKVQSDFSGGLISDYILGRLDIKRVANSARVFKNFFPSLQGPAVFRSGFKHVNSVVENTSTYKSIDVTLATDVPYRVVFEPAKIKVYDSDGVLKDTVVAPYSSSDIRDLRFSSETDALYISHGLHRPAKLTADLITVTKTLTATDSGVDDTLVSSDGFTLTSGLEVQGDDSWTVSDLEFDFEPILSPEPETKSFNISSSTRIVKLESTNLSEFSDIVAAGDGNWENYYVEYEAGGEKFLGKVLDEAGVGNYTIEDPTNSVVYVEPVESVVDIQDNAAQLYLLDSNEVNEADTTGTPLTGAELDKALSLDGVPTDEIHLRCDTTVFNKGLKGSYVRVGDDRRNNSVVVGNNRTTTRWVQIKEHVGVEDHPVEFHRGTYSADDYTSGAVYKAYGKLVTSPLYMKSPDTQGSLGITSGVLLDNGNRTYTHVTRLGTAGNQDTAYGGNVKDLFGNLTTAKQLDVVTCESTPHIESGDNLIIPTGVLTITAVANDVLLNTKTLSEFSASDVGRHCRGRLPSGLVFMKIVSINSATQVRAELLSPVPKDSRTLEYENGGEFEEFNKGAWYVGNYPRTVAKFEQRRIFGGTYTDANNLFFSASGVEESFKTAENDGQVLDTSGITYELDNSTAGVRWLVSSRDFVVGTTGGIYRIVPNQYQFGISPKTIRIELTEEEPCNEQGEAVGSSIFYPDQSGTRLMEYKYDVNLTNSSSNDVSKLVYPTFINDAIKQISYQHTPQPRLWCRTNSNKLFCLSYHRQEEFYAWSEHTVTGSDAIYDISVLHRGAQGELDQLWAVVKRGSSVHTEALSQTDAIQTTVYPFLDSHITMTKSGGSDISVTVSSRFADGDTVSVIQDGEYIGEQVVSGGVITIENQSTTQNLVVGTKYEGELKMMFPTWDGTNKPAYGSDNARIISLKPFLINSWSYSLGVKDSLATNQVSTTYGSTGFTGFDKERPVSGSTFGAENVPTIKHSEPYPLTIASIITKTDLN